MKYYAERLGKVFAAGVLGHVTWREFRHMWYIATKGRKGRPLWIPWEAK